MTSSNARITAILGPTNTGKTYLAMRRMMSCQTGIIGFPLRLLARENYDKVVEEKGKNAVALVTGEEKIVPNQARYFVCTVESMPLDKEVDFVGVDEIQLCGDAERGHIFTDRLLHCRGKVETIFLGSDTVRHLLLKLLPDIKIESRPRFSKLSYIQPKKMTQIPRRSAVVVFSVSEVYRIAEELRQHRGGCAVVLGALSPRTRNAQVEMYQAGEVDYMVATDAIGMGLNMDLDHVSFAKTRKFDGRQARKLTPQEIGQIAGRAGRHMRDGTFSTMAAIGGFDEMTVEAVENHRFDPLSSLRWRSRHLDFSHSRALLRSLEQAPPHDALIKAREAEDLVVLKQLLDSEEIREVARGPAAVRTLWDVAGVPDFRKTMTDMHISMLANVYKFLMKGTGKIPEDFVDQQISGIDDLKGDIDTLINRIANIRTWTFISHRSEWVANASYWQEKSKKIDDRLSDALHDRLTQRFVDRRAAILVRSLINGEKLTGNVAKDGTVVIEEQSVGVLKGFTFKPDPSIMDAHAKSILTAARRTLVEEVEGRLAKLLADNDGAFRLLEDGSVLWREVTLGKLTKGTSILEPAVSVVVSDLLEPQARERIKERLTTWLRAHLKNRLLPYFELQNADLKGTPRGLAYQLIESLGLLWRDDVSDMVKSLSRDERKALYDHHVRIGRYAIWVKGLTNPTHWPWRALLWGIWHDVKNARDLLPNSETFVVEMPRGGWGRGRRDFFAMLGYVPVELFNPRGKPHRVYVRVDALDHVSNALWQASTSGAFELPSGLAEKLACSDQMMKRIVNALGFKRATERDIEQAQQRAKQRAEREQAEQAKKQAAREEKETARKAELLAKEVVAAQGMELTPEQVLAAAEAEAEALRLATLSREKEETASAFTEEQEASEARDEVHEGGVSTGSASPPKGLASPADASDPVSEPLAVGSGENIPAFQTTTTTSADEEEASPTGAKELWVRVFRHPGRNRAGATQTNGPGEGPSNAQNRQGKKGMGKSLPSQKNKTKPNSEKTDRRRQKPHSSKARTQDTVDENSPFAALAVLKKQ